MADPCFIDANGHRTWLKWHRARRTVTDPEFTASRILEAMRLGASVEVDLVIHADGGFAILHDLELDHATTGTGLVRDTSAETLRQLHLRDPNGEPIAERVMLLEDLCALLSAHPAHPDALLQLDFKEDRTRVDARSIANFSAAVSPVAATMILSGGDAEAVAALAEATPGLKTGYDPTYPDVLHDLKTPQHFADFIQKALETAPTAEMIYLAYDLVLAANAQGVDLIAAVHAEGRRVDAWTLKETNPDSIAAALRLIALKVDQITTDDPSLLIERLNEKLAGSLA
ncbi:glycerophosphodiester phosphodiesterase [Peteryoungia ipomoeae]|uniref:Glycerophosphodiester phosphodiesterase n=1 Tax=Peteryoungia ipomoeae TaxID=1210932 RepID=A0A4S8NS95_9HYPH|nr:glycerophosphodiester phosphodiesterase family protein [Peteryoungia ipomoeae]THV20240.1 glycerophosphodiester phosphodiesterase [Peteryoungia ipomoeae]